MTRGKIIWLLNDQGDCVYVQEVNGDMGPDQSVGELAINEFKTCKTLDDFKEVACYFLRTIGYMEDYDEDGVANGDYLHKSNIIEKNFHNFKEENGIGSYYNRWNSDYLYILNMTGKDVETRDYDDEPLTITNGNINIIDFGKKKDADIPIVDEIPVNSQKEENMEKNEESGISKVAEGYVPVKMPLKEVVKEYAVEITKDDILLIDSLRDVLDSGVEKVTLTISDRTGKVIIDDNCYKGIMCQCVKVAKISDKGQFDTKTEAKLHIETSSWHFPCPDYKYSNIKRNLEKAICVICGIKDVEVKSFSTGIVEFDDADRSIHKE